MPQIRVSESRKERLEAQRDKHGMDSIDDAVGHVLEKATRPQNEGLATDIFDTETLALLSRLGIGDTARPVLPEMADWNRTTPLFTLAIGGWWLLTDSLNHGQMPRLEAHIGGGVEGFFLRVVTSAGIGPSVYGLDVDATYHVPREKYEPTVVELLNADGTEFLAPPGGNRYRWPGEEEFAFGGYSGKFWGATGPEIPEWENLSTIPEFVRGVHESREPKMVDVESDNNSPTVRSMTTAMTLTEAVRLHAVDPVSATVEVDGKTMTVADYLEDHDGDVQTVQPMVPAPDPPADVAESLYRTGVFNPNGLSRTEYLNTFEREGGDD